MSRKNRRRHRQQFALPEQMRYEAWGDSWIKEVGPYGSVRYVYVGDEGTSSLPPVKKKKSNGYWTQTTRPQDVANVAQELFGTSQYLANEDQE